MALPRILIAEDDDLQGVVVRTALQSRGYEADIVSDGLEAVRRLRTGKYDLAVLDYHLPEVDGLAAARLLHDFLAIEDRPRLIAVTASAEGLAAKEGASGGVFFDAVVSKRLGLPALLTVVDANLVSAAERQRAAILECGRQAAVDAASLRRRRWRAPLAALPALAMAALFTTAFGWAALSLRNLDAAVAAARQSEVLGVNAGALIGAMQDAELSQRSYLATRQPAELAQFEADAQHVDQLLINPATLAADGAPGFGAEAGPPAVIAARLRALAEAARTPVAPAPAAAREVAGALRDWAAGLVNDAQRALFTGLATVQRHIELVLGVLAAGVCYGLVDAARIIRRRWRSPASARAVPLAWRTERAAPSLDPPPQEAPLLIEG